MAGHGSLAQGAIAIERRGAEDVWEIVDEERRRILAGGVDPVVLADPLDELGGGVGVELVGASGRQGLDPVRADHGGIPWLDVIYDAQGGTNIQTRLEAFMHQVFEYASRKEEVIN